MDGLPRRAKKAKVHIDSQGRVTFLQPNEAPTSDEWWQSVLTDPRASSMRPALNDTMLGYFASMYVEIFCGNCRRHEWKKVDDLLLMYGERCAVAHAVNAQVNCRRPAKRCDVQFKFRQWEEVARLKPR